MFADNDLDRLQIPFGHELKTGEIMYLDIKEGAEFGGGPHGMLIGTTGSGKSEFLRTLILSLVAMHHPDQVNLLLTDFKGGSTFLGMEKLPHTAAVVTNMEEEAELVSRMGEVLTGELDRRQIHPAPGRNPGRRAGALSGVAEYEKYRERGADLPPLPTLFVVVDEFAELLQSHPDFIGAVRPDLPRRAVAARASAARHPVAANRRGAHRQTGAQPHLPHRAAHHQLRRIQVGDRNPGGAVHHQQGKWCRVFAGRHGGPREVQHPVHRRQLHSAGAAETNGDGTAWHGPRNSARGVQIRQFTAAPILDAAAAIMSVESEGRALREVVLDQLSTGSRGRTRCGCRH